jgi:AcrR family transcriptional regulator
MAATKKPRRTAQRILEATLALYNRHGEPNVSTTLIAAELGISPGNLYYHYPAKDDLLVALLARFERELDEILPAADGVSNVEDAWLFLHLLFELIGSYRFLYRDLNDLLSRNRRLEQHFQFVLANQRHAMQALLDGLARQGCLHVGSPEKLALSTSMLVIVSYWLSYEYVCDPRRSLEPAQAAAAMGRGVYHALALLLPHLDAGSRDHLRALAAGYVAA